MVIALILGMIIGVIAGWQLHVRTIKEMFLNGELMFRDRNAEFKWMIENDIMMAHRTKTGITTYYSKDGKQISEVVYLLKGNQNGQVQSDAKE